MATPRYITSSDLLAVLPAYLQTQLLDDDHDGSEDTGLADELIEDSADEVDAVLSARYSVPFDTSDPPKLVKWATKRLACYQAHARLAKLTDWRVSERANVLELLSAAADPGSQDITCSMGEDPAPDEHSSLTAEVNTETRVLSRTTLSGF